MTSEEVFQVLVSQTGGTYIPLSYTEHYSDETDDRPPEMKSRSSTYLGNERSDSSALYAISMSSDEKVESIGSAFGTEDALKTLQRDVLQDVKQRDRQNSVTFPEVPVHEKGSRDTPGGLRCHSTPMLSTPGSNLLYNYKLTAGSVVGRAQKSNPSSSTEIVGDLHSQQDLSEDGSHCNVVALCTLDGKYCY